MLIPGVSENTDTFWWLILRSHASECTWIIHETKEQYFTICLTLHMSSYIISYFNTTEKNKTMQFCLQTNSAILAKWRYKVHFTPKTARAGNTIMSLPETYIRGESIHILQKPLSGRKNVYGQLIGSRLPKPLLQRALRSITGTLRENWGAATHRRT